MQEITCSDCGKVWERKATRGPRPPRCADCKRKYRNEWQRANHPYAPIHRECADCGREMSHPEKTRRGERGSKCFDCAPKGRLATRSDEPSSQHRITCLYCHKELPVGSKKHLYCDKTCGNKDRGAVLETPLAETTRECVVCDREFVPTTGNMVTCPPTDNDRARVGPNTQARSWCRRRRERHFQRGTPLKGQPPQPFNCDQCGKEVEPTHGHAERRFCSIDCKTTACKREWNENNRVSPRVKAARLKQRRAMNPGTSRQWINGTCRTCGKNFTAIRAASYMAHYCSKTCNAKRARTERRARKRKAWVEEVWRSVVFERDGWICQLCGDPVDPETEWPDTQCASLDHITPLAQGGDHSYTNTQLAHHLCNSLKGDRESGSMMFAA